MSYCYRFKVRLPVPMKPGASKVLRLRLPVPFKSRRASCGRFGYACMTEDDHDGQSKKENSVGTAEMLWRRAITFLRSRRGYCGDLPA
jgi:hypothetical protein